MKYSKPAAAVAAALSMTAAPLHAGNLAEPLVEQEVLAPEVVATEAAAASTGGFILPLLLLAIIAAAASSSGGGSGPAE